MCRGCGNHCGCVGSSCRIEPVASVVESGWGGAMVLCWGWSRSHILWCCVVGFGLVGLCGGVWVGWRWVWVYGGVGCISFGCGVMELVSPLVFWASFVSLGCVGGVGFGALSVVGGVWILASSVGGRVFLTGVLFGGVSGVLSVGSVWVVGVALGVGGGRSWSTLLFWVGFLLFFRWGLGLGGRCGEGCPFLAVLLDTGLVFVVLLHGVNNGVFKEFGGLRVSPGSLFDSLGCCLCGFAGYFPFFKCVNPFHGGLLEVTFKFGSVGDASEVLEISCHTGGGVRKRDSVERGQVASEDPSWVFVLGANIQSGLSC